jgi:Flp pilus assembly protein TadB
MRDTWSAAALAEPWQGIVSAALRLRPEERPQEVQSWWQEYADFVGRGERQRIEREAQEAAAREKAEQERRVAEERARRVEAERNRQQAAAQAQREKERQAEEKRRLEALEAERLRQAEAARKVAPSHEGCMPVETPSAVKPAVRMNRRVLLLGGLGLILGFGLVLVLRFGLGWGLRLGSVFGFGLGVGWLWEKAKKNANKRSER